jgi:uncharacterized protein
MVQRNNKNVTIVKSFKRKLGGMNFSKFILFGSRAKGTERIDSDFDILAVSKDFRGKRWNQRPLNIYLSWEEDKPLEVLCYTPKEFNKLKKEVSIVREAVREGIEI